ncbi:hypothetical protein BH23BAC3_BH23BAC3_21750 [soil metagenome]
MINSELIFDLLQIPGDIPLTERGMAKVLTATFYPPHKSGKRLDQFVTNLKKSLNDIGVQLIPYEESLNKNKKVKPGIVVFEQGEGEDEDLAIRNVSTLYNNPIAGIFEGNLEIPENPTLQETLDSIVSVLAWNLAHVPLFIGDKKWTICTMNGSVIECNNPESPKNDILHSLIPKLAAQVVPPKREKITFRQGKLDAEKEGYTAYINDFMNAATVWRDNGLMLAHTSIEDLQYRNRFYKKIVSRYLDHRTGMSYGFLVKQLPAKAEPAIRLSEAPGKLSNANWNGRNLTDIEGERYVKIKYSGDDWIVKIPDVWLLSTRSGCNKTNLNPKKDILRLGLHNGEITIDTPPQISTRDCRPSYDTYAILAHAIGNVVSASLIMTADRNAEFSTALKEDGLSISHWHGYPDKGYPLPGYVIHGDDNPPVSCSTPQSAAYAFSGKLNVLEELRGSLGNHRGDIHIEPHHGTNISGVMSLTESAKWVDEMYKNQKIAEPTRQA